MTKKTISETAKKASGEPAAKPSVMMEAEVARRIRQHARSSMKAEICGVLIGSEQGKTTIVQACIPGVNAAQGGAHVTFTQDTWEHIYKVKDKLYPDDRIVGWYHSHPGFGVFLSDHDMFIQENFFSSPQQIAWVYDPHSDEEGCFGWQNKKVTKLDDVAFRFLEKKSESSEHQIDEDDEVEAPLEESGNKGKKADWVDVLIAIATYCLVFACGGLIGFLGDNVLVGLGNIVVPRRAVLQQGVYLPPNSDAIVLALEPELDQCVLQILNEEQKSQQQQKNSGMAPAGAATADLSPCAIQFEMRQSLRAGQPQMDNTLPPGAMQQAIPSQANPGSSSGSGAISPPADSKGGQDGTRR